MGSEDIRSEIVGFLSKEKISTTEVADALGKKGVVPLLTPLNRGLYRVGPIRCIFAANDSNYDVHQQIKEVQKGEIPVIFTDNCDGRAVIGDIVSKFLVEHRGAQAVVVQGLVRDAGELINRNYPIWTEGFTPIGCYNTPADPFPEARKNELLEKYEGAIAICDDCGVVAIPKEWNNRSILERLGRIQMQEAVWNYCLDELGWDTMRIVCDKEYLKDETAGQLPANFKENIERLKKPLDQ